MTLNEFQQLASRTLPQRGQNHFFKISDFTERASFECENVDLIHAIFGLAGEVGEITDPVKRTMFYGKPLDTENIKEEAGDLLWYIAATLCRALNCTLEELATANIEKLKKRYPEKYTDQNALARADKIECDQGLVLIPQDEESKLKKFVENAKKLGATWSTGRVD